MKFGTARNAGRGSAVLTVTLAILLSCAQVARRQEGTGYQREGAGGEGQPRQLQSAQKTSKLLRPWGEAALSEAI